MNRLLLFVLLFVSLFTAANSFADSKDDDLLVPTDAAQPIIIKLDQDTGAIIHEKFPVDIFDRFADDILFLLPAEMVDVISPRYDDFTAKSRFVLRHDYWKLMIQPDYFSEKNLTNRCARAVTAIKAKDHDRMVSELADMVQSLFEVANLDQRDKTGKSMEKRLQKFIKQENSEYVIEFYGYKEQKRSDIVSQIYTINKYSKDSIRYKQLVTKTAELWTSIWEAANGNKTNTTPRQQFLVKSLSLSMKPTLDLEARIKDYDEWQIVMNRNALRPGEWRSQLVEKRIDDYVKETVNYEMAERESALLKMMKGTREPKLLYRNPDRPRAVRYQQKYFASLNKRL